jgi:hypothetical protein
MAKITPVAEIDQLEDGQEIILLKGRVVQMYDAHRGEDAETGNRWSFQRFTLKDDTGTRSVLLKNRDDDLPKSYRGKEIVIEAHKGDKGWSGVYAFDDTDKKGKTTRIVKVTPTAQIYLAEAGPTPPAQEPPAAQAPSGVNHKPAAAGPPPVTATNGGDKVALQTRAVLDAKIAAARLANLFIIAVDVVEAVVVPHFEADNGEPINAEQHQAAIGHIFGCLQRDRMADGLPVKPLAEFMAGAKDAAAEAEARKRAAAEASAKAEALRKEAESYNVNEDDIPF